ncbi:MAG TPA: hypothetical protein GX506_04925 [Firmicutes bacterium]|nr:hypothetical protein [Bacillota bacterium]
MNAVLQGDGLGRLVQKILRDADAEADRIRNEARARADEIIKKANEEAEARRGEILERASREREIRKQRVVTLARLDGRRAVLAAKDQAIRSVFEKALEELVNADEDRYLGFLASLLAHSATHDAHEVILNARDRDRLGERLVGEAGRLLESRGKKVHLTLSEETRPIKGGFILRAGSLEVNCSLEALFNSHRDRLVPRVAKVLFGE